MFTCPIGELLCCALAMPAIKIAINNPIKNFTGATKITGLLLQQLISMDKNFK